MAEEKKENSRSIVGLYFVGDGEKGALAQNQGRIVSFPLNGFCLVQLFSWVTGEPTHECLASLNDLATCSLHRDTDNWNAAGNALTAKNQRRQANK